MRYNKREFSDQKELTREDSQWRESREIKKTPTKATTEDHITEQYTKLNYCHLNTLHHVNDHILIV